MASKNWLMASVLFVAVVTLRASVAAQCVGDCDGDQSVTVNEIIKLANIELGTQAESVCPHGIPSGAQVNVPLIIRAVNNVLNGCEGALPSPTPTVSSDKNTDAHPDAQLRGYRRHLEL